MSTEPLTAPLQASLFMFLIEFGATDHAAGAMDLVLEIARILALVDALLRGDLAFGVELPEVVVEQLHAELATGLDG
jgi:hypothetical protein